MAINPFPEESSHAVATWEDLGVGAPTLIALARLCSTALSSGGRASQELSGEAKAILFAARQRGVIEVKGSNRAYEAPARFLAVHVELDHERSLAFKNKENPALTIRFLDGFRQLCAAGLVMHHLYRDFSLTRAGFELAGTIPHEEVQDLISLAAEYGLHDL